MEQVSGWSEQGGSVVTVPGTQGSGSQRFQQSFRGATITVRDSSNNLATIYSDDLATPTAKANPFTASSTTGSWSFFTTTGTYSITFSGGSITAPFSITVNVGLGNAGGVPSYAYASLPTSKTQNAGDIARVTDSLMGLWMDSGTQWSKVYPSANASDFPGANAGAKILAAINGLPSTGGVVDATSLSGSQAISTDIFSGITKDSTVLLGASDFTVTVGLTIPANVHLVGLGPTLTTLTFSGLGASTDCITQLFGTYAQICGVLIDPNGSGRDALRINGGDRPYFSKLYIKAAARDSIHIESAATDTWTENAVFEDIWIEKNGRHAINIVTPAAYTGVFVNNVRFEGLEQRGLTVAGTRSLNISLNAADAASTVSNLTFIDCAFDVGNQSAATAAFYFERPAGAAVLNGVLFIACDAESTEHAMTGYVLEVASSGFCQGVEFHQFTNGNFASGMASPTTRTNVTNMWIGRNTITQVSGVLEVMDTGEIRLTDTGSGNTWTVTNESGAFQFSSDFAGQTFRVETSVPATGSNNREASAIRLRGRYWTGAASASDDWLITPSLGSGSNPISRVLLTHSGSSGQATISLNGIPLYANNAAALAGGLVAGDFYRTGADPDPICVVH